MDIVELNKKLTKFKTGDIVQIKKDTNNFYTIRGVIYESINIIKYELKDYTERVAQDKLRLIKEENIESNNKSQNIDTYFIDKNKEEIEGRILDIKDGLIIVTIK